jgi:cytochrome c oxidase cbb3-type subunit I/II
MKRAKFVALIAGFAFISLAILIQSIVPSLMKETGIKYVTKTVRTPLGELKDIVKDSHTYEDLVKRGREIYIREGCWYCHSMYVRPVANENLRWGPVSQVGEYAFDTPHLFGTRRIGPDLTRDGGKYGDDWHRVHFFDARLIVPDSIMPKFPWFYEKKAVRDTEGDNKGGTNDKDRNVADKEGEFVLNDDGMAIVAFVQNLGMNRGKWRDSFRSQIISTGSSTIQEEGSIEHGKEIYEQRCTGCHGDKGNGKGPAAKFFRKVLPRDFTSGIFKFRSTPTGSLPLDSDIYRTITMGVRGTAMPPWYMLPEDERWDVITYIKTFSDDFKAEKPEPPIFIPEAPEPTEDLLKQGAKLFEKFQCWQCHGKKGMGDGPAAATLTDDFGEKIMPTDFTKGIFKVGPRPEDIFRTFMTGLNGTPMPQYKDFLASEEQGWALSYFVLSFSADKGTDTE